MSACEWCWTQANRRMLLLGGSVADHYGAVLAEQTAMGLDASCPTARARAAASAATNPNSAAAGPRKGERSMKADALTTRGEETAAVGDVRSTAARERGENLISWEQIEPLLRPGMTAKEIGLAIMARTGLSTKKYTLATIYCFYPGTPMPPLVETLRDGVEILTIAEAKRRKTRPIGKAVLA